MKKEYYGQNPEFPQANPSLLDGVANVLSNILGVEDFRLPTSNLQRMGRMHLMLDQIYSKGNIFDS